MYIVFELGLYMLYNATVKLLVVYMNKQIIISQLATFGLDDVEAKIYIHLLQRGPQKPLELSRDININRSKIFS